VVAYRRKSALGTWGAEMADGAAQDNGPTDGKPGPTPGAALVAILGLVAPLATALGALALTGTVGRIQRNAEVLTLAAFILVVLASGLWAAGLLLKGGASTASRLVATLFAVAGTCLALVAAIVTAGRQPRPRIDASLNEAGSVLTATVTASSLKTEDRLAIVVDGLEAPPVGPNSTVGQTSLYQAYVGPDQDGNVSQKVSLSVPANKFTNVGVKAFTGRISPSCDDLAEKKVQVKSQKESGTGCVVLSVSAAMPQPTRDPQCAASRRGRAEGSCRARPRRPRRCPGKQRDGRWRARVSHGTATPLRSSTGRGSSVLCAA
jgi:hypothetical protein